MLDLTHVPADLLETARAALREIARARIVHRIWALDHTVWADSPAEITNRLGWLTTPTDMRNSVEEIADFVSGVQAEGFTDAVLVGMGGSSLAPEVFSRVFGTQEGYLQLLVLDSTDPAAIRLCDESLDLETTLFIISTKSGGTVETLSGFKYFYNRVSAAVGAAASGAHFVAITDPGSSLVDLASRYNFRKTFLNDPNIGGRYSALSYFGLIPAALIGVDLPLLLDRADVQAAACQSGPPLDQNHGTVLGALLGKLAENGRDKLTVIASPSLESFGDWVEQLVAESTGKIGRGILPVVGETLGAPEVYGNDRLFVYFKLQGDSDLNEARIDALAHAGHPLIRIDLTDRFDLGGQFFVWEMATAVAGYCLHLQPFDQPNVEAAKILARQMVAAYLEKGTLPEQTPALVDGDIAVFGDASGNSAGDALRAFLALGNAGHYVALQAFVLSTDATTQAMRAFQAAIRDKTHLATTFGYGPRFLHSTGQLHKGDAGNGLFIQFTHDHHSDIGIPDQAGGEQSTMPFGVLIDSQVLGDAQALREAGRRVIRFHLGGDVSGGIQRLIESLQ